ncbi:hypothetical protein IP88_07100 [alpha proteobacterium AAP81b]|nr:hypothetical protein IP88_07100 [alpha proteobacterium AAP81b]
MIATDDAIVCALLAHGETAVIARLLTASHGLVAAYVHGGRGRRLRPLLQPGNRVAATLSARSDTQLPRASLEPVAQRAALATSALALATIDWLCTLSAAVLPEGEPMPAVFEALDAVTAAAAAGADPVALGAAVVRYELLLLGQSGFGLDLASCAATGARADLGFVSPKSAQAVSRGAGLPYADKLLPLPAFLIGDTPADGAAVAAGLRLSGHFVERQWLRDRPAPLIDTRARLVARFD